eukprot:4526406-Pleurochrysis_carterae.AAC.1
MLTTPLVGASILDGSASVGTKDFRSYGPKGSSPTALSIQIEGQGVYLAAGIKREGGVLREKRSMQNRSQHAGFCQNHRGVT